MTVSTTTLRNDYTGNGVTTAFTIGFRFLDNAHIKVIRTVISTGVSSTLAITTDYTVAGAGGASGGTLTMLIAPTSGHRISILRNVPLTQLTDYVANDAFPAESHETALDKLTMIDQQYQERVDRSFKYPENEAGSPSEFVPSLETRRNKVWYWDANGEPTVGDLSAVAVTFSPQTQTFSGDGATVAFTLSGAPGSSAGLIVSIGGVAQRPGVDFSVANTTLTFTTAPVTGSDNILVQNFSMSRAVNSMDANAVAAVDGSSGTLWTTVQGFINKILSSAGASVVGFIQAGTGAVATTLQAELQRTVYVEQFGAVGDGVADDTAAFDKAHAALPASGGVICGTPGKTYAISRRVGVNDHWGINITKSNVKLRGNGAKLTRFNSDISTYALAYPIMFVGTPDSNVAAATENVTIEDFWFVGNNTQHALAGNVVHDFRNAIEAKNTKNLVVQKNIFSNIDSAVIFYQFPAMADNANGVYYNTTKSYNTKFLNNTCVAQSHAVVARALIHAVVWSGVDLCEVSGNYFEWCDDCVAGEGAYSLPSQVETNTWTPTYPGWALGAVKRAGRGWKFNNNICYNSSEHDVYAAGVDVEVCNNFFYTDAPTICIQDTVKIRSRNAQVTGNVFGNCAFAVNVDVPSFNVNVTGNTVYAPQGDASQVGAGTFMVNSQGLENYYPPRPWFNTSDTMSNITISGNTIQYPTAAASAGLFEIAFRVYSSASSTLFPNYELENVSFSNNNVCNYKIGAYVVGALVRNISINQNTFDAKPFTEAGFTGATVMNTYAPLVIFDANPSVGNQINFNNNKVRGAAYLFSTFTGIGTAVATPYTATGNDLWYIQNYKTADMAAPFGLKFSGNTGFYFLDRTGWFPGGINNSLNDGTNGNSIYKSMTIYTGTQVLFYKDDALTTILLG